MTLADFNVDPDRTEEDALFDQMKFEATMHCAVWEHIGEKMSSDIKVVYDKGKRGMVTTPW